MQLTIEELPSQEIPIDTHVNYDNPSVLTIPGVFFAPAITPVQVDIKAAFQLSSVLVISQSMPTVEDVLPGDDDSVDNYTIVVDPTDDSHDPIITNVNTVFDDGDYYLAAETVSILDHHYMGGILEFKVEYSNGDISWYPLELVKGENPQATAQYILGNDLGRILNGIHGRWAHSFLRSLRRTLRRL